MMYNTHSFKGVPGHTGFTLVEVMVAMVIFAIGLLGLAGLQSTALQNSHISISRSQAVLLAYDMADRIRANPDGKDSYLIAHSATPAYPPSPDCGTTQCTVAEMTAYDQSIWKKNLKDLLLSGNGEITGADPTYTITVRWDEDRSGATGTGCSATSKTDLRCFQLTVRL